jgi:hypothetical protein
LRSLSATNRLLVKDTLTSIERVNRLTYDIDQKRILIDAHVFDKNNVDMMYLEGAIAATDADFLVIARAYDQTATLPNEHKIWEDFKAQAAALLRPIQRVLALSRGTMMSMGGDGVPISPFSASAREIGRQSLIRMLCKETSHRGCEFGLIRAAGPSGRTALQ